MTNTPGPLDSFRGEFCASPSTPAAWPVRWRHRGASVARCSTPQPSTSTNSAAWSVGCPETGSRRSRSPAATSSSSRWWPTGWLRSSRSPVRHLGLEIPEVRQHDLSAPALREATRA